MDAEANRSSKEAKVFLMKVRNIVAFQNADLLRLRMFQRVKKKGSTVGYNVFGTIFPVFPGDQ